ncbi:MAG: ketoacyl-ACP synthase III [Acidobacteriia bacterium]|nr:ketoacyl-ACP synthase III [Terriglobia bacterium]
MKAAVVGIRYALPDTVLDNEQLAAQFEGWSAEKIYAKTGIQARRIAAPDECASDLAVRAAHELMTDLSVDTGSIDFLLYCTQTGDYVVPTTACLVQHRLGLPTTCGALDFNLGCSGYIYGLGMTKALIESGQVRKLLLITADTYSKIINPADKSVRTIFGDGATATLIVASEEETLVGPFVYGTDGSGGENFIVPAGGKRQARVHNAELMADDSGNARTVNDIYMNGAEVFNFTLRMVPKAVEQLLDKSGVRHDDVDLFVFHQANRFMLDHLQRKLHIPDEKFVIAMEQVGNTVSSSIPIALRCAQRQCRLKAGALLMLVGFGVGYSWGATLIRWPANSR